MLKLDEIRARCEAATYGLWNRHDKADYAEIHNSDTWGKALSPIALVGNVEDAEFIAHARTDIPALLAEVERLQRAEKERNAAVDCIRGQCHLCVHYSMEKQGTYCLIWPKCNKDKDQWQWRGTQEGR